MKEVTLVGTGARFELGFHKVAKLLESKKNVYTFGAQISATRSRCNHRVNMGLGTLAAPLWSF